MFKQVVCRDCGFLALCKSGWFKPPKTYHELTLMDRQKMADGRYYNPPNELLCRRGVWRDHYSLLKNVNTKRQCNQFIPYKPGYTPDEHKELLVNLKGTVPNGKVKKIVGIVIAVIGLIAAIITIVSFVLGYIP